MQQTPPTCRTRLFRFVPGSALALMLGVLSAHAEDLTPTNFVDRPAVFEVTTDVVNERVGPFTVTAGAFGNTLKREGKGGFEPPVFRTRLMAQADSRDRVIDDRNSGLHYFDSYASGYLDGADVRVYRVVDGTFRIVREDRVAPGGTVIEYWKSNDGRVIPAGTTASQFKWTAWSRPGAERWFAVAAVDKAGNVSEPSRPVRLVRPSGQVNGKAATNERAFRRGRSADTDAPPTPRGFTASVNPDGFVEMSWDPVRAPDLAGYRTLYSDTDPARHRGVYLQLEGNDGPAIRSGDMVFVSKPMVVFSRDWLSNRLAGLERVVRNHVPYGVPRGFDPHAEQGKTWKLVRHGEETPVPEPGEYYFEMTLRAGDTELVGRTGTPDLSNTRQDFYPVPDNGAEYVMEVWMKADRPDAPPVVFTWDGDPKIGGFVGRHSFRLSTRWQRYEARFTGQNSEKGGHAYLVLNASGPATFSFDNFRVYRADTPYLDYLPHAYEQLRNSGMALYRCHAPIKTQQQTYTMRQYLSAAGLAERVGRGNTLPQLLAMCRKAGINPWLQIEFHMTPDEWLGFAEYMAAPYDPATDTRSSKPWAHLRHTQGQTRPWVDEFDEIWFEIGNENWNRLFYPWTFEAMTDAKTGERHPAGAAYGLFHDHVAGILRESPYWTEEVDAKFVHALGGWITRSFTRDAARASRTADYITMAAYNGGWDEGEGPPQENPASYFNVLSQVNQTSLVRARQMTDIVRDAREAGRDIRYGVYEAGPGYALNGLNNSRVSREQARQQENVMKSKLAGTATIDSFLARASYGFTVDNFFTFAPGDLWSSHAKSHRGGQPHASFLPLQLFNQTATGSMLAVDTLSVPTVDVKKTRRREAVDDAPLAAVYATRSGDRLHLYCISRRVAGFPVAGDDGYTEFEVRLPFKNASSITLHRLSGDPTDHNINAENVVVQTQTVPSDTLSPDGTFVVDARTGGDARGLPPSEVFLYVFEGVEMPRGQRAWFKTETRGDVASLAD